MEIFIDQPQKLLKQVWKDQNVHIVQKQYVLGRDRFCLIDISMNAEGQNQDKIYIDSAFYRTNIRRGNTLVEVFDNFDKLRDKKSSSKMLWGRKGTQKIIDIRLEYLESITRDLNLNKDENKGFDVIFKNVNKDLQNGKRVQILKTQKANGQNSQVCYCYELDAWIICSKNVSMAISSLKDLQIYEGKRYTYSKQIARQFLKQISHLNKQQLKKLKKLLDGFTLIGEYCGNPQYQHLILYQEVRLIWFALVDNFTDDYCIDPFEVKAKVQQFGLKFVKIKRMGSFNNKKQFYNALQDLYLKIAEASMQDSEYGMQGSIVYFISSQMKNNRVQTKVLGSGKLKTIQYRYFRKIRQKLGRFLNQKQSEKQLIRKYQSEYQQLSKSNNSVTPFPQCYYSQILKKGCELIKQTKISEEFLRSRFVTVLKVLFYILWKNIDLKKFGQKLLKDEDFLKQVTKIPIYKYGAFGCNIKIIFVVVDLPLIFNKKPFEYLKIHFQKLNLNFKSINCSNSIDKMFNEIDNAAIAQKSPYLMNFCIDGSLSYLQTIKLYNKLKYKGRSNVNHQILFLTDKISSSLFENNQDEYPFKSETILLSYFNSYQQVKNASTIQQKINILSQTTKSLKDTKNFLEQFRKDSFKNYEYPMSERVNLQENDKNQINKIFAGILSKDKQYQSYCRLILKLDKFQKSQFKQQSEEQINNQFKMLIKSNFCDIPQIPFK